MMYGSEMRRVSQVATGNEENMDHAPWSEETLSPVRQKKKGKVPKAPGTTMDGTLFHQPWMMEAASLGRWHQAEVVHDGVTVAKLPYVVNHQFGIKTVGMPYYTRVLGPLLQTPPSKPIRQIENASKLIGQLLANVPAHDRFRQVMPVFSDHAVSFALNELTVQSNFTFVITPDRTPESVMADMKGTQKRNIVTSFDRLSVHQHDDLDQFISLARDQVNGQQARSRYRFNEIEAIFTAAMKHNQVAILSVYDEANQNMGTTIVLHDDKVAYFWLTTRRPCPGNRAYARLVWEAYQFAYERGLIFDMDEAFTPNGARYIAEFGGTPSPRHLILSQNLWFRALDLARSAASKLRR